MRRGRQSVTDQSRCGTARGIIIKMNWTVDRLTKDDAARMADVNALFARAFEDPQTYGDALPDTHYYTSVLAKPDVIVLTIYSEGQIAGALVAYTLDKLEQARREIYIYDLAVDATYRRKGVATTLIRQTQAIAAEIGAWTVYVQADYADPPAVALYEKLGTREEVLHFDLPPLALR